MKPVFCLLATFAIATAVAADDVPEPDLQESYPAPYYAPPLAPVYTPPLYRGGNSFHIIAGPAVDGGFSSAGYYRGPVFESYHAGSYMVPADVPIAPYPYNTGIYGPVMLDVLLIPDISSRF